MFGNLLIYPRATDRRRSVELPLVNRCPFAHVPPQKKAKPAPAAGPPASVRPPQAHSLTHSSPRDAFVWPPSRLSVDGGRAGGRASPSLLGGSAWPGAGRRQGRVPSRSKALHCKVVCAPTARTRVCQPSSLNPHTQPLSACMRAHTHARTHNTGVLTHVEHPPSLVRTCACTCSIHPAHVQTHTRTRMRTDSKNVRIRARDCAPPVCALVEVQAWQVPRAPDAGLRLGRDERARG